MSGLKITRDDLNDQITDLPAGPAENAIAEALEAGSPEELSCYAMLDRETQIEVEEEATDWYDRMTDDESILMTYGDREIDAMNKVVRRFAEEIEPVDIPEVTVLTDNLTKEMGELYQKYNVKNPKILAAIERAVEGKGRLLFQKADNYVEGLLYDARSVEGKVDIIHGDLVEEKARMLRNVSMLSQLYKVNQRETLQLVRAIAVLEQVKVLAKEDMEDLLKRASSSASNSRESEEIAELGDFVRSVEQQITAYRDRLIQGWATGPDMRRMRHAMGSMALGLNNLMKNTETIMKSTVVKWILLVQAKQAGKLKGVMSKAHNMWTIAAAEASAQGIPEITKMALQPTLEAETVEKVIELMGEQDANLKAVFDEAGQEYLESSDVARRARLAFESSNLGSAESMVDKDLIERAKRLSK